MNLLNLFGHVNRQPKILSSIVPLWQIEKNRLIIDGWERRTVPFTPTILMEAISDMERDMQGHAIELVAVCMEPHIMTGLWNAGLISRVNLELAWFVYDGWAFKFTMEERNFVGCVRDTPDGDFLFIVNTPAGQLTYRQDPAKFPIMNFRALRRYK